MYGCMNCLDGPQDRKIKVCRKGVCYLRQSSGMITCVVKPSECSTCPVMLKEHIFEGVSLAKVYLKCLKSDRAFNAWSYELAPWSSRPVFFSPDGGWPQSAQVGQMISNTTFARSKIVAFQFVCSAELARRYCFCIFGSTIYSLEVSFGARRRHSLRVLVFQYKSIKSSKEGKWINFVYIYGIGPVSAAAGPAVRVRVTYRRVAT